MPLGLNAHDLLSRVMRLKEAYDETNVLPEMEDFASLLGHTVYY